MSSYVPNTFEDRAAMLEKIGVKSIADLFDVPKGCEADLNLPAGKSPLEVERIINALGAKNKVFRTMFLGAGAYNHYIPPVVSELAAREEFVTAYTPYQAEMSQGILQSIFEYQTEIANLTGMDASNASHYDGATATADGILMCMGAKTKAVLSDALNPEYKAVVRTYLVPHGIEVVFAPTKNGVTDLDALKTLIDDEVGAVCIQQPNFFGLIEDAESVGKIAKEKGAKFVMSCYPVALALLKTPAECGADVAAGEGQPLGLPLAFGGPYLGFLTCRENLMMSAREFEAEVKAREQHIRREKSTSSICSNEALCALTSSIYLAAMGKEGLKDVAKQCVSKAHYMKDEIVKIDGFRIKYDGEFFNEFVIESDVDTSKIVDKLQKRTCSPLALRGNLGNPSTVDKSAECIYPLKPCNNNRFRNPR
ncbi:MAG: hypothetical protein BHV97_03695 [Clostridium sp. CAG:349_48_7]|nr:MAG: hypothetical protein BHV97_03695 [Clostridium sp. CAG:349_48_7]